MRSRRVWLGALVFLVVAGTTAAVVVWLAGGTTERATAEAECHLAGWVSGQGTITGTGAVPCDEPVTLTATAKPGWCFSFWPGDEPSLGCPRSSHKVVTVTAAEGSILWSAVFKVEPPFFTELSAPPICDVEAPDRWYGPVYSTDANGNTVIEDKVDNWYDPGEVAVRWTITGGTAPYTITIDGETRDGDGTYAGQTGTAAVSCALERGEPRYWEYSPVQGYARTYVNEPTVDSGYKLITASVTDADGLTAEAAVEVYAVFNFNAYYRGMPLRAGSTYRLHGYLVTIPPDLDMEYGSGQQAECAVNATRCTDTMTLLARQDGWIGKFWIGLDDGTEIGNREYWRTLTTGDSGQVYTQSEDTDDSLSTHNLDAKFDELAASLGKLPEPPAMRVD